MRLLAMKKQSFKTVEMTRQIRDAHYEQFKDKPIEERIAYYKERARAFDEKIAKMQKEEKEGGAA